MSLKRVEHWAEMAYHDFLIARAKAPYVWGKNDCALFAADGILAQTGTDIAADFRGLYADEAGAYVAIRDVCGGKDVADAAAWAAARAGMVERGWPMMAQRGDLVIVEIDGKPMAGLVLLNGVHVGVPGDRGLLRQPITAIKRSWAM